MGKAKRPSDMQRIAKAFRFTKKDLMLNRQGKLSEAQLEQQWRRFWSGITILTIMIVFGGAFVGVFLWGTAPEGTFPSLPSKSAFIEEGTDYEQLFFFGKVVGVGYVLVIILAFFGMTNAAIHTRQAQLYTYRGYIRVVGGYDEHRLHLLEDDGRRGFDINDAQYNLIKPIAEGRQFAVYYMKTRDGIVSLEPI
jgi:hypothetical protein